MGNCCLEKPATIVYDPPDPSFTTNHDRYFFFSNSSLWTYKSVHSTYEQQVIDEYVECCSLDPQHNCYFAGSFREYFKARTGYDYHGDADKIAERAANELRLRGKA